MCPINEANKLLLVEDDFALRTALVSSLKIAGFHVSSANSAQKAIEQLKRSLPHMVISDIQMEGDSGIDLLKYIRKQHLGLPVLLMTAYSHLNDAIAAIKLGACDYLEKPFEANTLTRIIKKYLPPKKEQKAIIVDEMSQKCFDYAEIISKTSSNILLLGESGSGKEVMAQFIHDASPRIKSPFVAINCAAIPDNMLESILFGYEKGAFTGAYNTYIGKFEQAQQGTLLLDEMSEMPLLLQAKLLRVLQEKEIERMGGKKTIVLDVRIIATSNRNLWNEVKEKRFREDLYYRLNVFSIECLPLRKRVDDIIPLATHFIIKYTQEAHPNRPFNRSFSKRAQKKLMGYLWPGNVRELDNMMQRLAVLTHDSIVHSDDIYFENTVDLQKHFVLNNPFLLKSKNEKKSNDLDRQWETEKTKDEKPLSKWNNPIKGNEQKKGALNSDLKQHEYERILSALKQHDEKKRVAHVLGISARTLRYKMAKMRELGYIFPSKNKKLNPLSLEK
jgi:two-component system response regulator FlrC